MTLPPLALEANQPRDRFYAGGKRIAAFRGTAEAAPNTPEDWVGSTTALFGDPVVGLTRLESGLLRDAIDADPVAWLGPAHAERYGADAMLLVKLLDAGQRLPVHAHPDDRFALEHLDQAHGKSEAWYVLEPGEVHLGFTREVDERELARLVDEQRIGELRALLHTRPVAAGDTVFVPAGVVHAIGEGVLLIEVQQPEDLSILLEWQGFDIDGAIAGHLGLGFDKALTAVSTAALSPDEVDSLISRDHTETSSLVAAADPFFRIERFAAPTTLSACFGILVVIDGTGELQTAGGSVALRRGTTVLIPHSAGKARLSGDLVGVVCRPPAI